MRPSSFLLLSVLLACNSSRQAPGDGDGDGDVADFIRPGPFTVVTASDTVATGGCDLAYTIYRPDGAETENLIVLGHGFQRSQAQMAGIAEHIASFGARVVTPDYCHLSGFDTGHPQNAADAVASGEQWTTPTGSELQRLVNEGVLELL